MITLMIDRVQRRALMRRVALYAQAGDRVLDHLADELDDLEYDINRAAMDDFSIITELRLARRKLKSQMAKVARLSQATANIGARLTLPARFLTLDWYEAAVLTSWTRRNTEPPGIDSAVKWVLEELADPHHSL